MVVRHDYQYEHGRFVTNAARFVRQFRKYAKAEAVLLAKFPDYYPYFGQTEEIGRFKFPGNNHRGKSGGVKVGALTGRLASRYSATGQTNRLK